MNSAEIPVRQQLEQAMAALQQQAKNIELLLIRTNQQQQIIDQYRTNIYTLELRSGLMQKLMEEKSIWAKDEFEKRWPIYLKNDVGIVDQNGNMEGNLSIKFYKGK